MKNCRLSVFGDLWHNQLWQWLKQGCRKAILGVIHSTVNLKNTNLALAYLAHYNSVLSSFNYRKERKQNEYFPVGSRHYSSVEIKNYAHLCWCKALYLTKLTICWYKGLRTVVGAAQNLTPTIPLKIKLCNICFSCSLAELKTESNGHVFGEEEKLNTMDIFKIAKNKSKIGQGTNSACQKEISCITLQSNQCCLFSMHSKLVTAWDLIYYHT